MRTAVLAIAVAVAACSGSPGGPTLHGGVDDDEPPHPLQSNDILARDQVTDRASVKHILIGWRDLEDAYDGNMDPRARERSRWDAEELTKQLYARAAAGEPFEPLMMEFSEDPGSAKSAGAYVVEPGSRYVFEFRRLSLRLQVGEVGKVLSPFGWHIIKRVK